MKIELMIIVKELWGVGIRVRLIICDMDMRDVFRVLGISSSGPIIVNHLPHPNDNKLKVYCSYDVVHVLKNIKHMLVNNHFIILPISIVQQFCLPSCVVRLKHSEDLVAFQEEL